MAMLFAAILIASSIFFPGKIYICCLNATAIVAAVSTDLNSLERCCDELSERG